MCIRDRCRRYLVVVNALDWLSISCFVPKILAVKIAVKLRSRPKKVFFGPQMPQFSSGEMTPTFLQQAVSATYRPPFGKVWLSSVCRWVTKSAQKCGFWAPICWGKGYPRFRTCIFKLHLLPTMWPIFVELRSAISEIRRRKKRKKERRKKHG